MVTNKNCDRWEVAKGSKLLYIDFLKLIDYPYKSSNRGNKKLPMTSW